MEDTRTAVGNMVKLQPYSSLKPGRNTTERHVLAKDFLEKISGGEMLSFILKMLSKEQVGALWKLHTGSFSEMFNNLEDAGAKRRIVASLGWPRTQFGMAGMRVGEDLFRNRNKEIVHNVGGRPSVVTDEIKEEIQDAHLEASVPMSRVLVRESKKRGETVTAQNMGATFTQVYEESSLSELMSFKTFRRHMGGEFVHSSTRTDVCDYCVGATSARLALQLLIDQNRKFMRSTAWKSNAPVTSLRLATFEVGTPKELREKVTEILETLDEIDKHKAVAAKQRAAYNEHRKSPPLGAVVVVFDYKQKGKLPLHVEQAGQLYYNQGTYSLLGFCLYWMDGKEVREHHVDFLLRCTNQDSVVTVECFKKLLDLDVFPRSLKLILWADSGKHFRSVYAISYFLRLERTSEIHFFEGGHGKNECDSHFGVVSRTLRSASRIADVNNLNDVQRALSEIKDTTCVQPRLSRISTETTVLAIPKIMSIGSFSKRNGEIWQHQTACGPAYELKRVEKTKRVNFTPKVSSKLPRPESDTDTLSVSSCSTQASQESDSSADMKMTPVRKKLLRKRLRQVAHFHSLKEKRDKKNARQKAQDKLQKARDKKKREKEDTNQ